jgi:hypothetical protein
MDCCYGEIIVMRDLFRQACLHTDREAVQHLGTEMPSLDPELTII